MIYVIHGNKIIFIVIVIVIVIVNTIAPRCARMTHICVSKLTNIGSDIGLSPGRRQDIIWSNVWIL